MGRIHIAVIDDGICEARLEPFHLLQDMVVTKKLKIRKRHSYDRSSISHGTVCAEIISKYCNCKDVEVSSIKVLGNNGRGSKHKLIKAMEWCMENCVDVINLSAGSVALQDKYEIREIVDKLCEKGIIIIAANKNNNVITYPAYFHNVIGVKCSKENSLEEGCLEYNFEAVDGIEITACGAHSLTYCYESGKSQNCNSFAAPMVTAKVASILREKPGLGLWEVKEKLWKLSSSYTSEQSFYEAYNNLDWIGKALVFSTNSRCLTEEFVFKYEEIINLKQRETNGANEENETSRAFTEITDFLKTRSALDTKSVLDDVDTLVLDLSHLDMDNSYSSLKIFLENMKNYKKNIVLINKCMNDDKVSALLRSNCTKAFFNSRIEHKIDCRKGKDIPLIAILNDCQKMLFKKIKGLIKSFKADGYNAYGFTNDPLGILYGCSYLNIGSSPNITTYPDITKGDVYTQIRSTLRFNDSDIGIIGMNTAVEKIDYEEIDFIELLEEVFDIDIYIVPQRDETYNRYEGILKSRRKKLIFAEDFCSQNSSQECINKLYEELLSLYSKA